MESPCFCCKNCENDKHECSKRCKALKEYQLRLDCERDYHQSICYYEDYAPIPIPKVQKYVQVSYSDSLDNLRKLGLTFYMNRRGVKV